MAQPTKSNYQQFLDQLVTQSEDKNIKFQEDHENSLLYKVTCPKGANGLFLLKVFVRMVGHSKFKPENRSTYLVNGEWRDRNDGEYLRFKIDFRDVIITVKCGATERQPGNAWVVGYGKYDTDHKDTNLISFGKYFDNFLGNCPVPSEAAENDNESSNRNINWQLAVLQLFEIARRIPKKDKHRDVPIALGILMALEIAKKEGEGKEKENLEKKFSAAEFFKLFQKGDRDGAYDKIKKRYNEVVLGAKTDEAAKPLTTVETNNLLAKFGYTNTNSDDVDDLEKKARKLRIDGDGGNNDDYDGNDDAHDDKDGDH